MGQPCDSKWACSGSLLLSREFRITLCHTSDISRAQTWPAESCLKIICKRHWVTSRQINLEHFMKDHHMSQLYHYLYNTVWGSKMATKLDPISVSEP